jgi:gamma-tubulin complex component 2
VLEPAWHQLEEQLANVTTVDEVLHHHDAFLDKCLRECLLSNLPLLKVWFDNNSLLIQHVQM